MEKQINLLNRYVSNIAVLNIKLHNLHWNVIGQNFEQAHLYLERLYDDLFIKLDEVAERIKMLGFLPNANLASFLKDTTVTELESNEITVKRAIEIAHEEYLNLSSLAKEIRSISLEQDDFVTQAMLEAHIASYNKEVWFMTSELK
ncbi:MAG: DNA starvation/stationary phase protection protein [Candidatus Izemoplasmatales bacterium]